MVAGKYFVFMFMVLCESQGSLVPQAILQLVQSNYGKRSMMIEVFYNSRKVKILGATLKLLKSEKYVKITQIDMDDLRKFGGPMTCKLDSNRDCVKLFFYDAIFLFDTVKNYQKFIKKFYSYPSRIAVEHNHLVHCENGGKNNIQEIITRSTYESFLIEKIDQISLNTMTMFTEKKCRAEQLVEINRFSRMERKWTTEKFFMPRIENFHGCELFIGLWPFRERGLPILSVTAEKNGTKAADGAAFDMIVTLSTPLNFTLSHKKVLSYEESKTYDFTIGANALELTLDPYSPSSDPIYSTSDIYVVPPGELYTSWEKLFLPFDWATWMLLGITFATAFLIILLIKVSKSRSIYDFMIGSTMTAPSLNVVAIFMGIGQTLLPQRNVSRFMLMCFILFSLIMRTAYQGKYFEFLTSDMSRKPMQTIEELKDKDFTAIVNRPMCTFHCGDELKDEG